MRISILAFGAIASVITINSVLATSSTVTSKDYVDAQDALKQNKIPATGTNASTPGDTVVTYTDTAGTIGERGICDADKDEVEGCDYADIVTWDLVDWAIERVPTITTSKLICIDDPDCTLWQVEWQTVNGDCRTDGSCETPETCAIVCCDARFQLTSYGYECYEDSGGPH
ncbi:MAG: hypothetical protein J5620_00885 [Alphaproteobacteria bacterium]|nr:hypothetical protein [Alphaproteobacteria bacterium]